MANSLTTSLDFADFPIHIMPIIDINSSDQVKALCRTMNVRGLQLCQRYVGLYRITLDYRIHYKYDGWAAQLDRQASRQAVATPAGTDQSIQIKFHFMQLTALARGGTVMIIALLDMDMSMEWKPC